METCLSDCLRLRPTSPSPLRHRCALALSPSPAFGAEARADLTGAEEPHASRRVPAWLVGLHCQRAVERASKGLLILRGVVPMRSHDLIILRQQRTPWQHLSRTCGQSSTTLSVDRPALALIRAQVGDKGALNGQGFRFRCFFGACPGGMWASRGPRFHAAGSRLRRPRGRPVATHSAAGALRRTSECAARVAGPFIPPIAPQVAHAQQQTSRAVSRHIPAQSA
jgi:hypothetical protein